MFCLLVQRANGLVLQAVNGKDYCHVTIKFHSDTVPKLVGTCLLV